MELSVFLCIGAIFSGIVYLTGRKLAWKSLMRRENKTAALHYALKNHRKVPLRIIRRLLREGADVNHVGVFGEPPLVAALSRRQPLPVIRELIKAGASLAGDGDLRKNPLMAAVFYRNRPEIVNELLNAGADPKVCLDDGSPLLTVAACFYHCSELLELLLEKGCELNRKNFEGMTALCAAACYGSFPRNIKRLLALGADGNIAGFAPVVAEDEKSGNRKFKKIKRGRFLPLPFLNFSLSKNISRVRPAVCPRCRKPEQNA